MTAATIARTDSLAIGRGGLAALHAALLTHAPDAAVAILQDAGFASGEDLYRAFSAWLPTGARVASPDELDAANLSDALSAFFQAQGWGSVTVTPLPGGAFAVDSADWAEAEPGTADTPMCYFSAGMLADFLGRLTGETVAVMEVECRSRSDARCRFLAAMPETLQRVYEAMTEGRGYEEALSG
jgi:predicted hydrocarbon binding protein